MSLDKSNIAEQVIAGLILVGVTTVVVHAYDTGKIKVPKIPAFPTSLSRLTKKGRRK